MAVENAMPGKPYGPKGEVDDDKKLMVSL